jgi:Bacteriophage baseplate protein W
MAMDRETGKEITGLAEIEQAVDEVLDTVPGDRIMRADYGSEIFELVDRGMDSSGTARVTQAVADALRRFEPRVKVSKVVSEGSAGELRQTIYGTVRTTSDQITVTR